LLCFGFEVTRPIIWVRLGKYVVGSRNFVEEVLAANSLETNMDFVTGTAFDVARKNKRARTIFKAV